QKGSQPCDYSSSVAVPALTRALTWYASAPSTASQVTRTVRTPVDSTTTFSGTSSWNVTAGISASVAVFQKFGPDQSVVPNTAAETVDADATSRVMASIEPSPLKFHDCSEPVDIHPDGGKPDTQASVSLSMTARLTTSRSGPVVSTVAEEGEVLLVGPLPVGSSNGVPSVVQPRNR